MMAPAWNIRWGKLWEGESKSWWDIRLANPWVNTKVRHRWHITGICGWLRARHSCRRYRRDFRGGFARRFSVELVRDVGRHHGVTDSFVTRLETREKLVENDGITFNGTRATTAALLCIKETSSDCNK
jgi:hypothetical protein